MFNEKIEATIVGFKLISVNAHHERVQTVRVRFEAELSDAIAAGLGEWGKQARQALIDGDTDKVHIAIGAVVCHLKLSNCNLPIAIRDARGIKGQASMTAADRGSDEPGPPMIVLDFEATWTDPILMCLAYNNDAKVDLHIVKAQLSIPATGDDDVVKPIRRRKADVQASLTVQ